MCVIIGQRAEAVEFLLASSVPERKFYVNIVNENVCAVNQQLTPIAQLSIRHHAYHAHSFLSQRVSQLFFNEVIRRIYTPKTVGSLEGGSC